MARHNSDVLTEGRIEFRVGINLGDVIVEGGDIFGDGVNVAARLEALAEPGSVLVSRTVTRSRSISLTAWSRRSPLRYRGCPGYS
jgi:class 3 adenylate cyclase